MDKDEAERMAEQILARARAAQPVRPKRPDRTISRAGFALGCAWLGFAAGLCVGGSDSQWKFAVMGLAIGATLGVIIASQRALGSAFSDAPQEAANRDLWSRKASGLIGLGVGGAWFLVNLRHVAEQGFVAIGLPLIVFALGGFYYFRHRDGSGE